MLVTSGFGEQEPPAAKKKCYTAPPAAAEAAGVKGVKGAHLPTLQRQTTIATTNSHLATTEK
jgi:hypothetical protein